MLVVAPAIATHDVGSEGSQSSHWYEKLGESGQLPGLAVSPKSTCAVPEIDGATVGLIVIAAALETNSKKHTANTNPTIPADLHEPLTGTHAQPTARA